MPLNDVNKMLKKNCYQIISSNFRVNSKTIFNYLYGNLTTMWFISLSKFLKLFCHKIVIHLLPVVLLCKDIGILECIQRFPAS